MRGRALIVVVVAATWIAGVPARADVKIAVNTTKDVIADDGRCSLREAIKAANTNTASGSKAGECPAGNSTGADVVALKKKTTYVLTIAGADEDSDATGDLDIQSHIEIAGKTGSVIKQTTTDRVIDVRPGATLDLNKVKVTGGKAPSGAASFQPGEDGGGLRNAGTLNVVKSRISGNTAGAGADAGPDLAGLGGNGGGIFNNGSLSVSYSKVTNNTAGRGGNGMGGSSGSGPQSGGSGGGIANAASKTATVTHTIVSGNTAGKGGNAAFTSYSVDSGGSGGSGGGLQNAGTMNVIASVIDNNAAGHGGTGGQSATDGGYGGAGGSGGGLANTSTLNVTDSTVAGNRAGDGGQGGAGYPPGQGGTGGFGGSGGGINMASGSTPVDHSTISGNATGAGGVGGAGINGAPGGATGGTGNGGGIEAAGSGSSSLTDDTISGNSAHDGGGIEDVNAALGVDNLTIADNAAEDAAGGVQRTGGTIFLLNNTIVADNTAPTGPDCVGGFTTGHYNLIGTTQPSCTGFETTDNIVNTNPKLAALANNGGPTKTHALRSGSPAIDAADPRAPGSGSGACAADDQRHVTRVTRCDIGAYEKT